MDEYALPHHGGDLHAVMQRYGRAADWIDFSANVNPAGPPAAVLEALRQGVGDTSAYLEYPTCRERTLRTVIAAHHALSEERVVLGNGSAAVIEACIRSTAPQRCVVPQPAFSEYARALQAQGCRMIPFPLDAAQGFALDVDLLIAVLIRAAPDACILTNPHNPTGRVIARDDIMRIVACCEAYHIMLLVDEAFIDYVPHHSIADEVNSPCLLVLRSLTKFYAMPGLRVGYGLATASFANRITHALPSWPITSLAIDAAVAALSAADYAAASRERNTEERFAFACGLSVLGLRPIEAAANFLCVEMPISASRVGEILAEHYHIYVRDCTAYDPATMSRYLRFAVRSAPENRRLIRALRECLSGKLL